MTSHDLARQLLTMPDLPVGVYALGHTYVAADRQSHGSLKIGLLQHYAGQHILIGDFYKLNINAPNWYVTEVLYDEDKADEERNKATLREMEDEGKLKRPV